MRMAMEASTGPLDAADVRRAVSELRKIYTRLIRESDLALFRQIARTHFIQGGDEQMGRLLDLRLVLEYQNGDPWADLHPVVREIPWVKAALAADADGTDEAMMEPEPESAESVIRRICRALSWADGFALYFVLVNLPSARRAIALQVYEQLERPVIELDVPPEGFGDTTLDGWLLPKLEELEELEGVTAESRNLPARPGPRHAQRAGCPAPLPPAPQLAAFRAGCCGATLGHLAAAPRPGQHGRARAGLV